MYVYRDKTDISVDKGLQAVQDLFNTKHSSKSIKYTILNISPFMQLFDQPNMSQQCNV